MGLPTLIDLGAYAQAVEDNYQTLADILLDASSGTLTVERLLSVNLTPVPPMKRGYAIWSEGVWADVMACFPEDAFPQLLEWLRTAPDDTDVSLVLKALTMWGDDGASALADWLQTENARLQARAVQGLTLYGDLLNALCDTETPSVEQRLHRENYPELVRLTRDWEFGTAPVTRLTGAPRALLLPPLVHLLSHAQEEASQIAILRCLRRLCTPSQAANHVVEPIVEIASHTVSRTLEREAVIALCHIDCDRAVAYMSRHWREDEQRRQMAAEILGLARTESAFDMLRELMTEPNAETRRKAISSMESFDSDAALDVLTTLQESDSKTQKQLLRSRSQLKRRLQRKAFRAQQAQGAIYTISPLVLLSQTPAKPVFSERLLTASMDRSLISDISSSRRYAVELGLLERQTDLYRLSSMGAAVHWVEAYVQDGLRRFAWPEVVD